LQTILPLLLAYFLKIKDLGILQGRLRKGKPVNLVAHKVGYQNSSTLARMFKKKTGYSPTDWYRMSLTKDEESEVDVTEVSYK